MFESMARTFRNIFMPYIVVFLHLFSPPVTVRYPYERLRFAERFRGRIVLELEKCIGCGICVWICPTKAMELVAVEGKEKGSPQINYGRCSFCGFCVHYCPRSALRMTDIVELSTDSRHGLIYPPERSAVKPTLKDVLPELRKELSVEVDESEIRYVGR